MIFSNGITRIQGRMKYENLTFVKPGGIVDTFAQFFKSLFSPSDCDITDSNCLDDTFYRNVLTNITDYEIILA